MDQMTGILRYASITEIVQLCIAFVGLALAMWGIWIGIEDAVQLTNSQPHDWRRLIAKGNLRGQLARMSTQGVLVYIGIVSVLLPPPYSAGFDNVPELQQSILARIGLIIVTTILTLDMFFERKQRIDFMHAVRESNGLAATRHHELLERVDIGIAASHAAEQEANTVNQKIAGLGEALLHEQEARQRGDDLPSPATPGPDVVSRAAERTEESAGRAHVHAQQAVERAHEAQGDKKRHGKS